MVGFVRYWIERSMEDATEREEKARKHIQMVQEGASKLKKEWEEPLLPKGYWNARSSTTVTKERLADAEAVMISPYEQALADMDASAKRRANARK